MITRLLAILKPPLLIDKALHRFDAIDDSQIVYATSPTVQALLNEGVGASTDEIYQMWNWGGHFNISYDSEEGAINVPGGNIGTSFAPRNQAVGHKPITIHNMSVYFVVKTVSSNGSRMIAHDGAAGLQLRFETGNGRLLYYSGGSGLRYFGVGFTAGVKNIVHIHNGASNQVLGIDDLEQTESAASASDRIDRVVTWQSGQLAMNGKFYEMLMFAPVHTSEQRAQVIDELKARHGVTHF